MNDFKISPLAWDTDFFGVKCGTITLDKSVSLAKINEIKKDSEDYDFVSIKNCNNNSSNNILIGSQTNAFLADVNIQFAKEAKTLEPLCAEFNIANKKAYDKDIIDIAKDAYKYSKFTNDTYLKERNGALVYVKWLENAFEKEDKYFVTYSEDKVCYGYLLFSLNVADKTAVIELIAVSDRMRGCGLGKRMICELEKFSVNNGIKKINVGTQINNITAMNFYHSCGFKETDRTSVYHLWNMR